MTRLLFLLGFVRPNRRDLKPAVRLMWLTGAISRPRGRTKWRAV